MLQNIHITVVVPVYNVESYLQECLDSICNQTEQFDEVILVNDGSTDNSLAICEKYADKYSHFILINQQNAGLSEARNVGLKVANGDYIVFIDSDDCVDKNMVQTLKKMIYEKEYDAIFFGASTICESGIRGEESYYTRDSILCGMDLTGKEYFMRAFPSNYVVSACLAMYRRDFLERNQLYFEKGIYFEDNDFHLRVCMNAQKVKVIPDALYIRRYRSGSIMTEIVSRKKCEDLIHVNELIWNALEQSELVMKYKVQLISYYLIYTWGVISESEHFGQVKDKWNNLAKLFLEKWFKDFSLQEIAFREMLALYLMLMETKGLSNIYEKLLEDLRNRITASMKEQLCNIPLNQSKKMVGIYGIGKHTEKLFELYRMYVGEIYSKLVFIVTEKKQGMENYQGYSVISCEEISKNVDCIIISSLKYQKDMFEMLKKNNISDDRIVKLYEQDDYCDWASVARIIL